MYFILLIVIFKPIQTYIPTQNVETVDPFPCKVCSKIYDASCQGAGLPSPTNYCLKAADVPVTYTVGTPPSNFGDQSDMCYTYLVCPAGTMEQFDSIDEQTSIPGNSDGTPTFAFCYEAGEVAGKWFSYSDGHGDEMSGMRCKNQ
ncbi:hypothetical protein GCK72_001688 [Caenorhabditis remanei]|uniref:DUF281 domain-containing protein n=1 Tax=Caenorhabditis remanei TaxID=31234 RepID=A0A6A5HRH7_CAERE|nr:hypothetical protein GCK72_001688 [Caenorhabditis remanei]KAF1769871.1 hypothetical protein GCK72_001688 [Caenorhabditis remanei]